MKSSEVRESFLNFFAERGHTIVPSASLVPKDDPTLLFTSAGMVQFKPYFAGTVALPYRRAASVQKCLRVTDLENVGKTLRHHTFFEMLGNFSFGDYFKKEAILWAWEYLTDVLGLDKDRLFASVFKDDDEAYNIWIQDVGLEPSRVVRLGEKDNFWPPAGGTGACGPCSEIFYDMGEDYGCRRPECYVGCDCERYLEIWNIVFPQFDQKLDGTRGPLKNRGIDTGMGLERLLTVVQKARSNYHTDVFKPLIDNVADIIGLAYGKDRSADINFNIIADHIRALVFAITDGVIPSNEERGYVLRKLLRRALRSAQRLEYEEPILYRLVGAVVNLMKEPYPEIATKENQIALIIKSEEERFLKTLDAGLAQFETIVSAKRIIDGRDAFKLYDTYGFPFDLIVELAHERNIEIDKEGFEKAMEEQRLTSRKGARFAGQGSWNILKEGSGRFVGYDKEFCETEIIRWLKPGTDERYEIVLEETPFYAEAGGQIGETGTIQGNDFTLRVADVFYSQGIIVHECEKVNGVFRPGRVKAEVDINHRQESSRAHTATHLLQAMLRKVLGEHIRQEGSLVEPGRFRFDFLHFNPLSKAEIDEVENGVNELIRQDLKVEKLIMPLSEAKRMGAIALFGEKYGEMVRVVKIEEVSLELCGGMHVDRTGEIGILKIQTESSAAAGIRRIEALVGGRAYKDIKIQYETVEVLRQLVGKDVVKGVERELLINKRLNEELRRYAQSAARFKTAELLEKAEAVGPVKFVVLSYSEFNVEQLRMIADAVNEQTKQVIGILFGGSNQRLNYIVFVSKNLTQQFNAVEMIKIVGRIVGGSGGGKPHLAEGGGGDRSKILEAIDQLRQFLINQVKA
ncbi:MAG: alanine--tRNA ligase [candidate division WOR-3 bacterium]